MSRVKSLVRLKTLTDELRLRASTTRNIGIEELLQPQARRREDAAARAVDRRALKARSSASSGCWRTIAQLDVVTDPQAGFFQAAETPYECVIVSSGFSRLRSACGCARNCARSTARASCRSSWSPTRARTTASSAGLELGINDYLVRPIDQQELIARLRTQVRRKRYNDQLRASVAETIEMAVTDGLTGLHNRRYLDSHLETLFDRAVIAAAAAVADDHRPRPLQVDQRHAWP